MPVGSNTPQIEIGKCPVGLLPSRIGWAVVESGEGETRDVIVEGSAVSGRRAILPQDGWFKA